MGTVLVGEKMVSVVLALAFFISSGGLISQFEDTVHIEVYEIHNQKDLYNVVIRNNNEVKQILRVDGINLEDLEGFKKNKDLGDIKIEYIYNENGSGERSNRELQKGIKRLSDSSMRIDW